MTLLATVTMLRSLCPEEAILAGRALLERRAFRHLSRTEDGQFLLGECLGGARLPYAVAVDLGAGPEPVSRCTCGAKHQPCKHAVGLLLVANAGAEPWAVAPPPADLLERRAKARRGEKSEGAARSKAPSRTSQVSNARRLQSLRDAVDTAERTALDLVTPGLGAMDGSTLKALLELAAQLGDHKVPGLAGIARRLGAACAPEVRGSTADHPGSAERPPSRVFSGMTPEARRRAQGALLLRLWRLSQWARRSLEALPEGAEPRLGPALDSALGHSWQQEELREAGLVATDLTLLELAQERVDDEVSGLSSASGWLLDLGSGAVVVERTSYPLRALESPRVRHRPSRRGVLFVPEALYYPSEGLHRRYRAFPEEGVTERPLEATDIARVHACAESLGAALERHRQAMLRSPFVDEGVFLVRARRFGAIAGALVMEGSEGHRVALRDPRDDRSGTLDNTRHVAAAHGHGAVLLRLRFEAAEQGVFGQALSFVTDSSIVRLGL
ncbi:MAG: SWIM zinc finger family protein [Deltaproteobacteria bacterium]|nr:SWIM zinc finger family protein [Deltaproteobacteria bacterium]